MSKTSAIAIALMLGGINAAVAQDRPDSTRMSCAQAAGLVQRSGALVLGTGGMTYDRFVSDKRFCAPTEQLKQARVPAADTPYCFVGYTCIEPFVSQTETNR